MSKCKAHIEEEAFNKAVHIATVLKKDPTNTVKFVREEGRIFYPITDKKNIKGTFNLAKTRMREINMEFESSKYGRSAFLNNGYVDGVGIDIDISSDYIQNLVKKNEEASEMKEAMEIQRQDAERAGITPNDRYLFDEMPMQATPIQPKAYGYAEYLDRKVKIRNYLSHRSKVLKKMHKSDESPTSTRRQSFMMREQSISEGQIIKRLTNDIIELKKDENIIKNFFQYFHGDLKEVRKIMETPTLENLAVAQKYMESLSVITNTSLIEEGFLPDELSKLPIEIQTLFKELQKDYQKTEEDFKILSEKESAKMLDKAKDGEISLDERQQIKELEEMIKREDSNLLSFLFLPIDEDGVNAPPVQKLVRKIFDDAMAQKETVATQQELLGIKSDLEKELPNKSRSKASLLGSFFTEKDYSIFKRITNSGNSRLVSKFSLEWENITNSFNSIISKVSEEEFKSGKTATDKMAIDNKRKKVFDILKREGVNFIDIRTTPEFLTDPEIDESITRLELLLGLEEGNLGNNFTANPDEADYYKETIIQSLVRAGGTRKSAEREYNKIIAEQKEKFHDFEIDMEQRVNYHLKEAGVDNFSELEETRKTSIKNYYLLKSPISFVQTYEATNSSQIPQSVNMATENHAHSLEYVSFLPTKDAHFDGKFTEQIESNETIYRAWELFSDGLKFINDNRKYSQESKGFIDSLIDVSKEHKLEIAANGSHLKSMFTRLGDKIGTFADAIAKVIGLDASKSSGEVRLNGSIKSIDESVALITRPIYARFRARGIPLNHRLVPGEGISDSVKRILNQQIKLTPVKQEMTLKEYVENAIRKDIFESQDDDMINSVISQMADVQVFKAKKEIETKLLYFKNLVLNSGKDKNATNRKRQIELMINFIDKHLYGINNRAKGDVLGAERVKTYNREDRIKQEMLAEAIKELKGLVTGVTGEKESMMLSDIENLEKSLANLGSPITLGSLTEAIFIKARIVAGLGYNIPSQIMNISIGNMAGRQNDGIEWRQGNYAKAHSYERMRKKVKLLNSKETNDNHELTNALINSLGIFQNSANEIEKMVEENTGKKAIDFIKNPLHLVGETEKVIQKPQILAMLGDENIVNILDKNGESFPIFNADDHSNPHPAFKLENGVVKLTEEFDTPENRATWITRSSQEYADAFGESGALPRVIARINGDYRSTSTTKIKDSLPGAMLMIFKTWFPAYIQRRYGKEHGILTNLNEKGHGHEARVALIAKGALYASLVAGGTIFSPIAGVVAAVGLMGAIKLKNSISQDVNTLQALNSALKSLTLDKNFALGLLQFGTIPIASGVKLTQKMTNMLSPSGKTTIPNSAIDSIIGMTKKGGETDLEFEENKARMHFLLSEIANLMQMLTFKIVALMLLAPDDEEDKEYKQASRYQRITKHQSILMYYMVENMTNRFASDISLDVDLLSLKNMSNVQASDDVESTLEGLGKMLSGDTEYKSGPNKGRGRMWVQAEKHFIPKGVRELTQREVPSLGFSSYIQKDYTPDDLVEKILKRKSDAKTYTKVWTKQREDLRAKLREEYEVKYPNVPKDRREKNINKRVNQRYPSIKKYFKPSGKAYPEALPYLQKYKQD